MGAAQHKDRARKGIEWVYSWIDRIIGIVSQDDDLKDWGIKRMFKGNGLVLLLGMTR